MAASYIPIKLNLQTKKKLMVERRKSWRVIESPAFGGGVRPGMAEGPFLGHLTDQFLSLLLPSIVSIPLPLLLSPISFSLLVYENYI